MRPVANELHICRVGRKNNHLLRFRSFHTHIRSGSDSSGHHPRTLKYELIVFQCKGRVTRIGAATFVNYESVALLWCDHHWRKCLHYQFSLWQISVLISTNDDVITSKQYTNKNVLATCENFDTCPCRRGSDNTTCTSSSRVRAGCVYIIKVESVPLIRGSRTWLLW